MRCRLGAQLSPGAKLLPAASHVIIYNSVFKNCPESAVKITNTFSQSSNISFVKCTWENNEAEYGGAVRIEGAHLYTRNTSTATGEYFVPSHMSFINCTFKGNKATKAGGAVYVADSTVEFNPTRNSNTDLYPRFPMLFHNCNFESNKANELGGAVYAEGNYADRTIAVALRKG